MKTNLVRFFGAVAFGTLVSASLAHAVVIDGINYVDVGSTENLTAVFTTPTGGSTVNTYSGLVDITVSGAGFSFGSDLNDAFYLFDPEVTPVHAGDYYQLGFGTSPLAPFDPAQDATNAITYDFDAGLDVTPSYVPGYRSDHTYHLALDTGLIASGTLFFGVSDGDFADNGGAFNISVTQLVARNAVPEGGATLLMLAGALLGLATLRRQSPGRRI